MNTKNVTIHEAYNDSDKQIIENIISKIKGEKANGKRC